MLRNVLEEKAFYLSLVVSLMAHAVTWACLMGFQFREAVPPKKKETEIVYQMPVAPETHTAQVIRQKPSRPEIKPALLKGKRATGSLPLIEKREGDERLALMPQAKAKPVASSPAEKRQITVPLLKSEKSENLRYLNYHDIVRRKIRDRAYSYVDDARFQQGEVYLTFLISNEGHLLRVQIIEDRTHANEFLRSVGLRSIKESSPFPPFPAELPYPELSFNVIISFELTQ